MRVFKLLPVLLLLLIACVSASRHHNETSKKPKPRPRKLKSPKFELLTESNDEIEEDDELSQEEKEEKLKILTMEGKPGWLTVVKKAGKAVEKKWKKEIEERNSGIQKDYLKEAVHDSSSPTELINTLKDKLSTFTSPLATRVKTKVTDLNTQWKGLEETDRKSIMATLTVISTNIEKFGDAGSNPTGAIQGAVNIVGAVASFFGPPGQLVSIGLSFVSALLGLFGKGPKPKPLAQVVREQIDEALSEFKYEALTDKANGLVSAFAGSTSYLEGVWKYDVPIDKDQIKVSACRVPMTQGDMFMGELSTVIRKMFKNNKASEAKKCLTYCELYAQLAGLKDMIITQLIAMSTNVMTADAVGLLSYQQNFRDATKLLLEPLYKTDYGQKIMPYFDPDTSLVTDSYATNVLNLGKYDRSLAGMYCIRTPDLKDFIWSTLYDNLHINGKPYTTTTTYTNNANCYWKLVPHGNYLFSIVNKKGCATNEKFCGWILSFDILGGQGYVNVEASGGIMWEIKANGGSYKIRSKWGCGDPKQNSYCNRELRMATRIRKTISFRGRPPIMKVNTGHVLPADNKFHWKLVKQSKK